MSRQARIKASTNMYHVVIRGIDQQNIFEDNEDFKKYLEIIRYYRDKCEFEIFAYALMSNHVHLLLHAPNCELETIFKRVGVTYVKWFNTKYDRGGYLQQGRFFSEPVETLDYFLKCVRYIHFNPVKAGLCENIVSYYPWSSMHEFQRGEFSLVSGKKVLKQFGGIKGFLEFHNACENDVECERFLDINNTGKRTSEEVAREKIKKIANCSSVSDFQKLSIKEQREKIKLLYSEGLSLRQLNRLTGVARAKITRWVEE